MDAWLQLHDRLRNRGGVGHVVDGERFGLSRSSVTSYWQRHRWPMPHPGVILLPGVSLTYEVRALAATTWIGDPVVATAASGLYLHGVIDRPPPLVTLVVPHTRRNRFRDGVVVHRSDVPRFRPTVTLGHTPVATVPWSLRDRAVFGGPHRVRTLAIRALQRRAATLDELLEAAAATPTAPGVPELIQELEVIRRDRVDSGVELDVRHLLRGGGFDPWPRPFPYRCPDGRVIHLDVPFPGIWFAIECDDPSTHGTDRAFYVDRTRWNQAMRGGWKLGFVWRDRLVDDPGGILEEVAEAFATADPDRPPPVPAHECGDRCPPA